ncbi:hypothetical protein [Chryseobacterium jejuense]|uniref:Uncharacterized protein n=1 Tax=Chryseobacterium jejuense TaxID=445960 RepID=A0A2X2VJI3_CHRJE|nr:hypothetical protein [Chryseobacterium jejuense]SQB28574.1 Uncharacterised protein [Chryseobacterium jejuense]
MYKIWKNSKYDFRYIPSGITPTGEGTNPNAFFQTSEGDKYYKPDGDEKTFATFEFGTIDLPPQYPGDSPGIGLSQQIENNYYIDKKLDNEIVHITRVITNNFRSVNQDGVYIGNEVGDPKSWPAQKEHMYLHLYQPVNIVGYKDYEDLKDVLPKDPIMPAFVYYYCEEYDRLKDINAAWSLGIDVSTEILLFFVSGGASVIKDLRYLKYAVKIGKALRATAASNEAVLVLRGAEVGFEVITITVSMCFYAMNYIATTSNSEAAKQLANLFFWLTMLGAGATLYARTKATKAANKIASNPALYNAVPNEVKSLIDKLVGAEAAAITAIKGSLHSKYPKLYDKFIELSNIGGVDFQKIFLNEFSKANPDLFKKLNDYPVSIDNWKSLFNMAIKDRKDIDLLINQDQYEIIKKFYIEPPLRNILEPLEYTKRWSILNDPHIINGNATLFNAFKSDSSILKGWMRFQLDPELADAFKKMGSPTDVDKLIILSKRYGKASDYGYEMLRTCTVINKEGKSIIITAENKMKRLLEFPEATHNVDYYNNRRVELNPPDFYDGATASTYRVHETDSFINVELTYGGKAFPPTGRQNGDIFMQGGIYHNKTLDPLGITHKHRNLVLNPKFYPKFLGEYDLATKVEEGFLGSIAGHFNKISNPITGKDALNFVVIDYKYFDEMSIAMGQPSDYFKNFIDQFISLNFSHFNNKLIKLNYAN